MILFPYNLVPNRIEVVQLPRRSRGVMTSKFAYFTNSLKLNDTAAGGVIRLKFENYPIVKQSQQTDSGLNFGKCNLDRLGWELAWEWFDKTTEAGHFAIAIPPDHAMFDGGQRGTDVMNAWYRRSLDQKPNVWRVQNFTAPVQRLRQNCDFEIVLAQEYRTPRWT